MVDDADDWAGVEAALARFGLPARLKDRPAILAELDDQIRREAGGQGDQFLLRLLCVQLFSLGVVDDSIRVWRAKQCNFDTHCGIDVALLCGAGVGPTKEFLAAAGTDEATAALQYLTHCEAVGNFAGFDVATEATDHRQFYHGPT